MTQTTRTGNTGASSMERMLPAQAKDALRHLELFARRTVDGMLHGIHRSRRIGVSTDFDHHKLYIPGDPLKHIDWKISARHDDKLFVKRYREDTSLTVQLVVDRSGSMLQATEEQPSKYWLACQVASCLAYLIIKERDAVGLALTAAEDTAWLPARSTQVHMVRILESLVSEPSRKGGALEPTLKAVLERQTKKGLIVLASDLLFEPEGVRRALASLQARGHEVLIFQLRDQTEEEFPFNRWVEFRDLENPATKRRLDTVPLRKIYLEEYQMVMQEWKDWAAKYGIHLVSLRGEDHVPQAISEYLVYRSGGQGG